VKARLIELTDDDRTVIFGMLMEAAAKLRSEARGQQLVLWRRCGKREFESADLSRDQIQYLQDI
jgi:RNA-binding protein YhbY